MEVHAHAHPAPAGQRKKWTHYLWEFLMLFLAVFCGFLAENQREHMVDNRKETEFMRSFIEDLKEDTSRMTYCVRRLENLIKFSDSLVKLYVKGGNDMIYEKNMARYGMQAGTTVDIVFSDRTASQLKGTGAMRLVRKKDVADSILKYWNNQVRIMQIHDWFNTLLMEQRKIGGKLFEWYPLYYQFSRDSSLINLQPEHSESINNKELLREFLNMATLLQFRAKTQYLPQLKRETVLATKLMTLIRNKYHAE